MSGQAISALDFLTLSMEATPHAVRQDGVFHLSQWWTSVSFGSHILADGWWIFEVEGDAPAAELRLEGDGVETITLTARPGRPLLARIAPGAYSATVMTSPLPGVAAYRQLRLRQLRLQETAEIFARRAYQLMASDRPLARAFAAIDRLSRRGSFGALASEHDRARPWGETSIDLQTPPETPDWARHGQLWCGLSAGDVLTARASLLLEEVFRRDPTLKAVVAESVGPGPHVATPANDPWLLQSCDSFKAPVFLPAQTQPSPSTREDVLREIIDIHGIDSVGLLKWPVTRSAGRTHSVGTRPIPHKGPPPQSIAVIIPTKLRMELLHTCLQGLSEAVSPCPVSVVIVDNGAPRSEFAQLITDFEARLRMTVVTDHGDFNFSRLVNKGVAASASDVVVLLNDDVAPLDRTWLAELAQTAMNRSVGAVGPQLVYPDKSIQHAGVSIGLGDVCGHLYRGLIPDRAREAPQIACASRRLAVTGACIAVRRDHFQRIGGFDDKNFPVTLNDIDFCLRLEAQGLNTVYRGDVRLVHAESKSRGSDESPLNRARRLEEILRFRARWRDRLKEDPWFSPTFDRSVESGTLRPLVAAWL